LPQHQLDATRGGHRTARGPSGPPFDATHLDDEAALPTRLYDLLARTPRLASVDRMLAGQAFRGQRGGTYAVCPEPSDGRDE
jgi:hypothetical protein